MYFKSIFGDFWRFSFFIFLNNSKMYQDWAFTAGWKRNRLFVYSAGRAIVSRDGQTTQICCPTAQNTQKPTPTKEAAFGRPPLWFPLCVLVFVYFGLLGYISVLLGHLLTLLPYQLSRQIVYLRAFTHPGATSPKKNWPQKPFSESKKPFSESKKPCSPPFPTFPKKKWPQTA